MAELEEIFQLYPEEISKIAIYYGVKEIKLYQSPRERLIILPYFQFPKNYSPLDRIGVERRLKSLIWEKANKIILFSCYTTGDLYHQVKNHFLRKSEADVIIENAQTVWRYPKKSFLPYVTFLPRELTLLILDYL